MVKKAVIAASELHQAAGKALKRVALLNELLVVERDGYPIAVLMSFHEYEDLMRLRALAEHKELTRRLGQEAEKQGLTEEQLMAEIKEDKSAVYKDTYGAKPA